MNISAFADEVSLSVDEQIIALKENGLTSIEACNLDGKSVLDITEEKAYEVKVQY